MPYYFYMCDMIPGSEHWRLSLAEAQKLQHQIMGYLPGFATPRIVCDVPYVGKRWVHQVARYDTELGISYWTKNYRTAVEAGDPLALSREYPYYDPIHLLPEQGQQWWRARDRDGAAEPAGTRLPRDACGAARGRGRSTAGAARSGSEAKPLSVLFSRRRGSPAGARDATCRASAASSTSPSSRAKAAPTQAWMP